MYNLSSEVLDDDCKKLLSRGKKFTPTPRRNLNDLQSNVNDFKRKLRLQDYFKDQQLSEMDTSTSCYQKSDFVPPKGTNIELDNLISLLDKQSKNVFNSGCLNNKQKRNLSVQESNSLYRLKDKTSLHFTEADKGGAIVILDYNFYRSCMLNDHLNDKNTYELIPSYNNNVILNKVRSLCNQYKNNLSKKQIDYLTKFRTITPYMYGLPKLHKCTEYFSDIVIDSFGCISIPAPTDLKFRPIISSRFSPTNRLSSFLDEILKPLVVLLGSHCRDTFMFLEKLPTTVEKDSILMTFDVISLYTSIPHELGYRSIDYWLGKHNDLIPNEFDKSFILKGLEIILENNYFTFEDNCYLQKTGTAMGTKVAPTYASLVMGYLEDIMYSRVMEIYPNNGNSIINSWLRYLDDCWLIWKANYGNDEPFVEILNDLHSAIKFTNEKSTRKLNFLDVLVYVDSNIGNIHTDLYRKPTDTMNYVPFNSAHPHHILKNIPYNLARRIKMIVSDKKQRIIRYKELRSRLIQLKYPCTLIDDAIIRAEIVSTQKKNAETDNKMLPFIQTYNQNNPDIFSKVIKPITNTLKLLDPFKRCTFKTTYRQPQSILSFLSRNNRKTLFGIQRCGEKLCKCCDSIMTGKLVEFKSATQIRSFTVHHNFNCLSSNVVYKLQCRSCNKCYVGQTGDTLRHRMTVHRQQISDNAYTVLNVSKHISMCGKGFFVAPFYQLPPNATRLDREAKESMFIKKFQPELNSI